MKKLALTLLVACLLVAGEAAAEPILKKPRPTLFGKLDAWQVAIAGSHLLPGYFLEIAAHEYVGHALPITLADGTVLGVNVLPKRYGDTWFMASTRFEGTFTKMEMGFIDLGPYLLDFTLFTATEMLFISGAVSNDSIIAPILLVTGEFWPWLDFTSAVFDANKAGDLTAFEKDVGVHPAITRTIGGVLSAAGLVALTLRAIKIIRRKDDAVTKKRSTVTLSPFVSASGIGIILRF